MSTTITNYTSMVEAEGAVNTLPLTKRPSNSIYVRKELTEQETDILMKNIKTP